MRLIYHPDAEAELIEAARYYEARVATLGVQFLVGADQAVAKILEAPERWRIIEAGVRSYLMPRFPYAIYYRDYPDHLHVLAFKHHSRHPDYWRYRVPE
ncbi:MAG TPA: type II toxin-antitoxin system RelE/ParE family toxin [Pyrinomonadaceae bacterium]|nr:type II toxin-antitoxin system RelE/ParE family toxin [Pyrinomonadaceae bacterium]